MGKRKRKDLEKELRRLRRKIDKIEAKTHESPSRCSQRSRSHSPRLRSQSRRVRTPELPERSPSPRVTIPEPEQGIQVEEVLITTEAEQISTEVDIDVDILTAMGTVEEETVNGPPLHPEIAQRWTPVLTKGLKKDEKILLINQYTPFNNIPAMIPPKLNPELSAAVTEPVKMRDSIIEYRQKNIAAALAAVGCGLQCFLTKGSKVDGIKNFNDAAKILCEIIHNETQNRRILIQKVINKDMKDSLQAGPDELLFGKGLTDRIRTTKAVQKSAQDLLSKGTIRPNIPTNQQSLNLRVPPRQAYKRTGFKPRNENQLRSGEGKQTTINFKKTRPPPQQQRSQHRR